MHCNITLPYPLNICIVQCVSGKCHLARVMDCFFDLLMNCLAASKVNITYIRLNEFLFAAPKK